MAICQNQVRSRNFQMQKSSHLSLLSEAMMFDSENYLLKCLQKEKRQSTFAHLIERSRYNRRRKQLKV